MKTHARYPLLLEPIYKSYVWGGTQIAQRYNRANTPNPCAESWEVSDLPGSESVVTNGAFEGIGLRTLVETFGRDLIGSKAPDNGRFPLLIKILDASACLSVQVHPDEKAAAQLGGQPKHEMWYVLDREPGAKIYAGLEAGATPESVPQHLHSIPTEPGDVIDLSAGTVHAIDRGNLIYEVQQPSDTTYRLYDWGRPRELHLKEALASIHWDAKVEPHHVTLDPSHPLIPRLSTNHFSFATLSLVREKVLRTTERSCMILFCKSGKITLDDSGPHPLTLLPGTSVLIPAKQVVRLHPLHGPAHCLVTQL